jgi:hypothetical protein
MWALHRDLWVLSLSRFHGRGRLHVCWQRAGDRGTGPPGAGLSRCRGFLSRPMPAASASLLRGRDLSSSFGVPLDEAPEGRGGHMPLQPGLVRVSDERRGTQRFSADRSTTVPRALITVNSSSVLDRTIGGKTSCRTSPRSQEFCSLPAGTQQMPFTPRVVRRRRGRRWRGHLYRRFHAPLGQY